MRSVLSKREKKGKNKKGNEYKVDESKWQSAYYYIGNINVFLCPDMSEIGEYDKRLCHGQDT